jgi:WD40 repeat protein
MKFTDSIVVTTSADGSDAFVWEPKTRALLDCFKEETKFKPATGTLSSLNTNGNLSNPGSYVVSTHSLKAIFTVWQWGKKDPIHRFSSRDEIKALKFFRDGLYCVAGTAKGDIIIWQVNTGEIIADFQAHFGGATSCLDVSNQGDLVLSAGADSKLKLWVVKE